MLSVAAGVVASAISAAIVVFIAVGLVSALCGRHLRWVYAVVVVAAVLVGALDLALGRIGAVLYFVLAAASILPLLWR